MTATESAIYTGTLFHKRFRPTTHAFDYQIYLFWLKLSELETLENEIKHFSCSQFALARYKRSDYLGDESQPLENSVITRMSELNGSPLSGEVFMLGQLRMLGMYFSPVNFYFLRNADGEYTHMLAEVSNTPWNERHHYLVDFNEQKDTEKAFHVSPFNPIDMTYKWRIGAPEETFSLVMDCFSAKKDFSAGFALNRLPMNSDTLGYVMRRTPSMTIKTVVGIYWQAIKLWIKRTPVYSHP
ncbi:DUF1365 domain-containing protein [Alteromonas sp. H39]|uniref:DUF1365 domain-containing protein n=1 Tax=Alteromonas sp. H39 TaxID=3389876 RepID=UPI0039E0552C